MNTKEKEIARIKKNFKKFLADNNIEGIKNLLKEMHPADIAENLKFLEEKDKKEVFNSLGLSKAAKVMRELEEVDYISELDLLNDLSKEQISKLIEVMAPDDAADILSDMPEDKAEEVLDLIEEKDSEEISTLMEYAPDTAGGIMSTEYLALAEDMTVTEAIKYIRTHVGTEAEKILYIYVIDNQNRLKGIINLNKLMFFEPISLLKAVMDKEIISVKSETDQEEVARIVTKYDLLSIPVVNDKDNLLGRITVDDVIDVIKEEAEEDIYHMAGTDEDELLKKSILKVASIRLPWLLVTLLGGMISCILFKFFKATLSQTITLTFFVPVITAMGGNIGIQSATIVVRGLATDTIDFSHFSKVLFKEIRVGLVMGIVCGTIVGITASFIGEQTSLGFIIGISMFAAIIIASTIGTLAPIIFKKINIDPAISSGPFVTMANDVAGLLIYFSLATILLKWIS